MVLLGVDLLQVLHHLLQAVVVPLVQVLFTSTVSHRLSVETVLGDGKPIINIKFSKQPQSFLLETNRGGISIFPRANFWETLKHYLTSIPCQLRQPSHPPVPSLYLRQSWKPRRTTAGAEFAVRKYRNSFALTGRDL